jgi:hypothetical protein
MTVITTHITQHWDQDMGTMGAGGEGTSPGVPSPTVPTTTDSYTPPGTVTLSRASTRGGGGNTTVHVHVAGSIVAERDLGRSVRDALLSEFGPGRVGLG